MSYKIFNLVIGIAILLFVMIIVSLNVSADLTEGLISYYSFDIDYTDVLNTNDLTNNGATLVAGKINNAADLVSGDSDYLSNTTFTSPELIRSYCFWINPDTSDSNEITMSWYYDVTDRHLDYFDGTNYHSWLNSAWNLETTEPPLSTWTFLCTTFGGTGDNSSILYVNGTKMANSSDSTVFASTQEFFRVGFSTGNEYFDGQIDELGVWNRTLTDSEVSSLWSDGSGLAYPFPDELLIHQNSYNLTSGINSANQTIWRTNQSAYAEVKDSTPSVSFAITSAGNCSIGLSNYNFTTMVADDANTKCSTTTTTNHTCTLPSTKELSKGTDLLYIACKTTAVENATSTSGSLAINLINSAPNAPTLNNPTNDATNQEFSVTLNVTITDNNNDTMNVTFYNSSGTALNTSLNLTNGSDATYYLTGLSYSEVYNWTVNITDGTDTTSTIWWGFTTKANQAPDQPNLISPTNGSTEQELTVFLNVTVTDNEGESMDISFFDANLTLLGTVSSVSNGSNASYTWANLDYGTKYNWFVNVTDGTSTTTSFPVWNFTTKVNVAPNQPVLNTPTNGSTNHDLEVTLNITVTDPESEVMNVTFFMENKTTLNFSSGIASGDNAIYIWSGLEVDSEYRWFVNITDSYNNVITSTPIWNFTTRANTGPYQPYLISPINGSTGQDTTVFLNVNISDKDGHSMNVSFFDANKTLLGSVLDLINGSNASYTWVGLAYNTKYNWFVNVTDSENSCTTSFPVWNFTTKTSTTNCTITSDTDIDGQTFTCTEFVVTSSSTANFINSELTTDRIIIYSGSRIIKDTNSKFIIN